MGSPLSSLRGALRLIRGLSLSAADRTATSKVYQRSAPTPTAPAGGTLAPVQFTVRVKPGSRRGPLVETDADGALTVHVRERAADGAANAGVITALAAHFGVRRQDVTIRTGHAARIKRIEVAE